MTISLNDRNDLRYLKTRIEAALGSLSAELGVSFDLGKIAYELDGSKAKIALEVRSETAPSKTDEAKADFLTYAPLFGAKPEDYGRKVVFGGTEYRITGIKPQSRRFPFTAERVRDGKGFKLPFEALGRGSSF